MPGHHHRAGSLRQANKKNKRGNASKRSLNRIAGGKIAANGTTTKKNRISSSSSQNRHATYKNGSSVNNKARRVLLSKQRRDTQRKKLVDQKRLAGAGITSSNANLEEDGGRGVVKSLSRGIPKLIGVISLTAMNDEQANIWEKGLYTFLQEQALEKRKENQAQYDSDPTALFFEGYKKNPIKILTNSHSFSSHYQHQQSSSKRGNSVDVMIIGALDLCRVCDLIIFTFNGDIVHDVITSNKNQNYPHNSSSQHSLYSTQGGKTTSATTTADICEEVLISERGDQILSACKSQGLPTVLTLLTYSTSHPSNSSSLHHRELAKIQKRKNEMKRFGQRVTTAEFGEDARFMDLPITCTSTVLPTDNPIMIPSDTNTQSNQFDTPSMDIEEDESSTMASVNNPTENMNATTTTKMANKASISALIRFLCSGTAHPPKWVNQMPRPYLVTSSYNAMPQPKDTINHGHAYNPETKELQLSGHIRGTSPFCIYNLLHVPLLGTFMISKIQINGTVVRDSSSSSNGGTQTAMDTTTTAKETTHDSIILPTLAEEYQDSLDMFATPDALEGEQNLIGFDEEDENQDGFSDDDNNANDDDMAKLARPAGWSDYQSAWLDGIDANQKEYEEDHGELAKALNAKKTEHDDLTMDGLEDHDSTNGDDDDDGDAKQKRLRCKEDLEFPDEVEVKQDELARDRFARYRSLKSFRKSYWDPKENLPETYARIYHFASFKNTQKDILAEQQDMIESMLEKCDRDNNKSNNSNGDNGDSANVAMDDDSDDSSDNFLNGCVLPGSHVTITLSNVPKVLYQKQISSQAPINAVSLLPHENKVSVLHMGITSKLNANLNDTTTNNETTKTKEPSSSPSTSSKQDPIKSKDDLIFRCGWRTWTGRPVFSQNNLNSDKHKLERFLPPRGAFLAASVFGPVCYSPCPVLCFSQKGQLVAVGSILGADADRIVIKRIILTGYPSRVHKRHATVKNMFYNPEDVKWFKPAGLTTKHGLQGNIMESVGDHGTFKCLFNQPVKQHDTVCLPLYKRIFPKFAPQTVEDDNGNMVVKDLVVL